MLLQRVITAVILLLLLLPTIFFGTPRLWAGVSLIFLVAAAWEWTRLLAAGISPWAVAGLLALLGGLWIGVSLPAWLAPALWLLAVGWWLSAAVLDLRRVRAGAGSWPVAVVLLLACWVALYALRERGAAPLLVAMAVIWVADIGAYFVGRAIGARKLAPRISPGKSWEGAIGGAALVVVVGLIAAAAPVLADTLPAILVGRLGPLLAALVLLALSALSVIGDLHESLLKRQAGVKDSGRTLPGHGGVLDRIDALIPTMPLAALLHLWLS